MFTKRTNLVGIVLLVSVWSVILVIPRTRSLLSAQFSRAYSVQKDVHYTESDFIFPSDSQRPALEALAKKHPNDAKLLAVLAENTPIDKSSVILSFSDRLPKLDALIERFPDDIWLLQYRGRESLSGGFKNPPGSYVGDSDGKRTFLGDTTNWLTPAQMQQTLRIMHLAETRDPQNSFYNWVEAECWYGLGNPDKALNALQRGSRKTSYDDGSLQAVNARLHAQVLLKQPLLEDRWKAVQSQVLPQYARMREVTRVVEWQGAMQEKAGNHQRALEIYGAQMRLSTLMLHDTKMLIGRLVAQAMLAMTWKSLTRGKLSDSDAYKNGTPDEQRAMYVTLAQRFADYANAHGRADLGSQAIETAKSIVGDQFYLAHYREAFPFSPQSKLNTIGLLKFTGMVLMEVVLISTVLWLFLLAILALVKKLMTSNRVIQEVPLKQFSILNCVLFVLICTIVGTVLLFSQIPDKNHLYLLMISPQLWDGYYARDTNAILGTFAIWIPWVSLALLFLYCLLPSSWKIRKSTFAADHSTSAKFADGALVFAGKMFLWLIFLPFQLLWAYIILTEVVNGTNTTLIEFYFFLMIPLPLFLALISIYWTKRRQTSPPQFSAAAYWTYSLKMLRNSLALLIVICSLAYGVTSLASLPLRKQANASLDRYVKVGEVNFMRKALKEDKSEYT